VANAFLVDAMLITDDLHDSKNVLGQAMDVSSEPFAVEIFGSRFQLLSDGNADIYGATLVTRQV
jgi:hypothetical protein